LSIVAMLPENTMLAPVSTDPGAAIQPQVTVCFGKGRLDVVYSNPLHH
jgi:hypothetical protein